MHEKRIEAYTRRIATVVDEATYINSLKRIDRPRTDGSRSYELNDEVEAKLKSIVRELLQKDKWAAKFSEEYLKRKVQKIVSDSVGTPDNSNIQPAFERLCHEFESFNAVYSVLIPLSGITLKVPELKIGSIELVRMDDVHIEELARKVQKILSESPQKEEDKQYLRQQFDKQILQFRGEVCAKYSLTAEPDRAKERAHQDLSLALDLLRYAAAATSPSYFKIRIGLKGDFNRGVRLEIAHADDKLNIGSTIVGPRAAFEIDAAAIEKMHKLGVFELGECISPEKECSEFVGVILDSIHWHAHAQELQDETDRVLNFITSIECFFETKDKFISTTISEGMALIFGDDFEDREQIRLLMRQLYDLRSRISHGGDMEVLNSDVAQLRYFSGVLIDFAYRHREAFQDKASFGRWINALRLGYSNDPEIWKTKEANARTASAEMRS